METPLQRAVRLLKTQTAVAEVCGPEVKQQNVWHWLKKSDGLVPSKYAVRIERAIDALPTAENPAGERVTRRELCPDFPWQEVEA